MRRNSLLTRRKSTIVTATATVTSNTTASELFSLYSMDHRDDPTTGPMHVGLDEFSLPHALSHASESMAGKSSGPHLGEWEPLPEREKTPLTTHRPPRPPTKPPRRKSVEVERQKPNTTKSNKEDMLERKRHYATLLKADKEDGLDKKRPSESPHASRKRNESTHRFRGAETLSEASPMELSAPMLSRASLERMRNSVNSASKQQKSAGRQIEFLEPSVKSSSSLLGMVVKARSQSRSIPENIMVSSPKKPRRPKRRRRGDRKADGRTSKSRKEEQRVEEGTNPLTRGLLRENAKAISTQRDLQGAVASAILSRRQNHTVEFESSARGSSQRRAQWQSCYRGYFVRRVNEREVDILRVSAGVMKQVWVGYFSDIQFHLDLIDVVTVQSVARRRKPRAYFLDLRNAAIRIQSCVRRWLARGKVDSLRIWQRNRARREKARNLERRGSRQRKHVAATRIQSLARQYIACRQVECLKEIQKYVRERDAVTEREEQAATVIQRSWRGYSCHLDFRIALWSVVRIQTLVRQWLARRALHFQRARHQHFHRLRASTLAREKEKHRRLDELQKEHAATSIQASWRRFSARLDFEDAMWGAVTIQTATRRWLAVQSVQQKSRIRQRKIQRQRALSLEQALQREEEAAAVIQSSWRGHQASRAYETTVLGVTALQALSRGFIGRKQARDMKERHEAAQRSADSFAVARMRRRKRHSPVVLHGTTRRKETRDLKKQAACAIKIQSVVRRFLAMRRYCVVLLEISHEEADIQSSTMLTSTIVVQAAVRTYLTKVSLHRQRCAAVTIQCVARGFLARFNLLISHYSASEIQRAWSSFKIRQLNAEAMEMAAIRELSQARKIKDTESFEKVEQERMHDESVSDDSTAPASSTSDDKSISRPELHAQLLAFESKRRSTYDPVLTESTLKWRSSVGSLQLSVEEMVNAERLIFGSAVANHVVGDAMFEMSDDGVSLRSEGISLMSEGSLTAGPNLLHRKRKQKQESGQDSSANADAYMDVSDEMTRVREDLEAQVNALSEMGGVIIAELEAAEMCVTEAWDAYDTIAMNESFVATSPDGTAPSDQNLSERVSDLWLEEMHYCVAVAFQVLVWQRAISDLSNFFRSVSSTERKHRSRLRELLLVFASQRRRSVSSYSSMQAEDLHDIVDQQVDQIHPQIEELIRETENRPLVDVPSSFLRIEASDFTSLDSPMTSTLLLGAAIVEKGSKGGFGRKTRWERILAIWTSDSFLHLFEMSASSPEVSEPDDAFHELIMISQAQKMEGNTGLLEGLTPVDSLFLPSCTIKVNSKEKPSFEVREERSTKRGKTALNKLLLRTASAEETELWIESLAIRGQD